MAVQQALQSDQSAIQHVRTLHGHEPEAVKLLRPCETLGV